MFVTTPVVCADAALTRPKPVVALRKAQRELGQRRTRRSVSASRMAMVSAAAVDDDSSFTSISRYALTPPTKAAMSEMKKSASARRASAIEIANEMTLPVIMIPKQLKIEYETMSAQPDSSANAPHSRRDERGGARIGGGGGGGRSSAAITLSASSAA